MGLDGDPRPVDLVVDEVGEIVVNNVHVGAGAQASRAAPGGRTGCTGSVWAGSTWASSATDRRPDGGRRSRRSSGSGSRSTARWWSTSTGRS